MKSEKSHLIVRSVLITAILVLINIISIRLFTRLDLTAQGVFTLAQSSKDLVAQLDDRVNVKGYFTEDLPAPYNGNRRAVLDILNEYRAYAKGNLQFEFINPEGEKGEQEAQQQGVVPVQVQVVNEDKLEVKRGYMGLVFQYEDRRELLPVVQNLSSLEYDISSILKRLTSRTKKTIGFTSGHGEPELANLRQASQMLAGQYELLPINLAEDFLQEIRVDALIVVAPQKKFGEASLETMRNYLARGGKLALLLNRMNANLQSRYAQPIETGLEGLLQSHGVAVNADLVRDVQCANISVVQQQGSFTMQTQMPFAYLPVVSNFNKDNLIVKDLSAVIFHFVSSIDTAGLSASGSQLDVLVRSSKQSGRQGGFIMLDPFQRFTREDLGEDGIPLAVALTGGQLGTSRLVVVGDGDFMQDEFLGNRGNLTFFVNIVDYLADDAGLITIRSKNIAQPPLDQVSDGTKRLVKYGNLLLPPLMVIAYGFVRWRRRIVWKRRLESQL
ncbi:MAG: hypothetical protein FJ215_00970 [Ignavibacteria bacterium]|nr:hypothetical protein [Ignavibacteria bacterium]